MTTRGDRLNEEIAFHLEQQTARNIRKGMSPDEARRAALKTFGGVEQVRESTRDQFRGAWLADLARDARIAMRTIARTPSSAVTAIVTFALGVGAAAAMYSVFEGVLLRPLPYPGADRIVRLYQLGDSGARGNVSEPNFNDWRDGTRAFAAMAETASLGATPVSGAGDAQLARMALVSAPFFDVMGVAPVRGRAFTDDERRPGGPRVAIVSAAFWIPWKGTAAPNGEIIRSGTDTFTIVGVMPSGFDYPSGTAVWLPREMNPPQTSRTAHNFQVVARLADGVPLERAINDISSLSRALKARHGDETWMADATAVPLLEVVTSTSKATLQLLFAASILLLLVACTNVSNLLVARAAARRAEFAVQLSMGATSGRIGRQLLAETLVLAMAGTALGVVLAVAAVRLFVMLAPASVQRLDNVSVSWTAVVLAVAASTVAAGVLSLVTALGTRTTRIADALADQARSGAGSRRQLRLREGLIVVQVALTLVLLAGAALLGRSLDKVLAVAPGYSLDDALVVDVTIPGDDTERAAVRQVALQESIMQRLRALPGVGHVGLVNTFPIGSGSGANGMFIEMSRPDEITTFDRFTLSDPTIKAHAGSAEFRLVGGDYFAAMAIPLVRGRFIDERDGPGAPHVAVISQSLADAHWPGRDPIGRWVQFGNMDGDMTGIQVVGIVGDVREQSPEARPAPMLYVSSRQRPGQGSSASIVVRGPDPQSIADQARRIVRDLDPEVPVTIRTVAGAFDTVLGGRRFAAWLVSAFGVTALVLAMLGVYGLVAFMVSQRRREMGIRMALGARPASLVWLVVSRGAVLAVAGALVGIAVSRAASGLLEGLLFGVTPGDAVTLGAAVAVLLLVSAGASYAPARRILAQSPARTLRDA
jgi:putative ABC transport system permease protein